MRHVMLTSCLAAVLCATSAHAAGGGAGQSVSYSWTGLYGGINVGYGWGNSDWDFASGGSTSTSDNSGVIGLQAGYNAQINDNWVAGIEASLDGSRIDGKSTCFGNQTCETEGRSLGDVSARLGYASGQSLLYVKGGIAYEDTNHYITPPGGPQRSDNGGTNVGYLLGVGAEYALMSNFSTKLEYNYIGVDSFSTTIDPNTRVSAKEPINLIKLGMNLKFTE